MSTGIRKLIAMMLVLLFSAFIFAGCSKSNNTTVSESNNTEQQTNQQEDNEQDKTEQQVSDEQEIKMDGELRLASDWPFPFHGNPFGPNGVGGVWWFAYEPFAYYIPGTGEYIPRLAEKWETDGNKVTIYLREDVKYSDGQPFTAKDVVNNIYIVQAMWSWPYEIKSVEATDDHTVVFTLTSSSFLHTLLTDGAMASLAPAHIYGDYADVAKEVAELGKEIFYLESEGQTVSEDKKEEYNTKSQDLIEKINNLKVYEETGQLPVVGTFTPVKVTQTEMELAPNEYHWTYSDQKINKILFRKWSSNEFVWASLISNEIDASHPSMPKDVVEQLESLNQNIGVITASDLSDIALVLNYKNSMFQDINLRKAIAHILERNKVRDVSVWQANSYENYAHGLLKSMAEQFINEDTLQKLSKYNYDTAKAEQILVDAGYKKDGDTWLQPNGQPVAFTLSVYAPHNDWVLAAREVVQQLNNFGFKVEMKLIPEGMRDQVMRTGDYEAAIEFGSTWQGYPHPLTGYQRLYTGDLLEITGFPSEEKFSTPWGELSPYELTMELQSELGNDAKANELIQQLAYITNEYLPVIPLYEKVLPIYINDGSRVTGWPATDDPIWSLAPGGIERVYNYLISNGILEPVK